MRLGTSGAGGKAEGYLMHNVIFSSLGMGLIIVPTTLIGRAYSANPDTPSYVLGVFVAQYAGSSEIIVKISKCEAVTTTISSRNTRVLNLYAKLGFRFMPPEITFHWLSDRL
jgi:hypothetical protein